MAMFFVRSLNIPVHSGFNTARHAHVYSAACRRHAGATVRFYCKLRLYEPEVFIQLYVGESRNDDERAHFLAAVAQTNDICAVRSEHRVESTKRAK